MSDLVSRLRAHDMNTSPDWPDRAAMYAWMDGADNLLSEAAAEITRLQKELETARRYVETVHGGPGPDATDEEWMSYDAAKEAAFQAMCAALKDKEVAG